MSTANNNERPVRVCIVDDDRGYRHSLMKIFEDDDSIRIYNDYESGTAFLKEMKSPFKPDVCLIDVVLKDMSGIDCAKVIKEMKPDIHLVIMTAYPNDQSFMEAQKLGADYVEKGPRIESFLTRIVKSRKESRNEKIISLKSDNLDLKNYELIYQLSEAKENLSTLTKMQLRIVKLKQKGKTSKEIAKILEINEGTGRTHFSRAMRRLDIPNFLDYIVGQNEDSDE